ncbi:16S rRNA (cytidine(1402)-2'-O)-methyltransferase [Thermosulfuriphilus sp.]
MSESNQGVLFVVATPIGNLKDITIRALEVLKEVDIIAAEDTRTTRKLLSVYGIKTPLISLHEHNEQKRTPKLIARLKEGAKVALVSEAGTPGISDPGAYLVRRVREAGLQVIPVPGPSAPIAALSVSGFRAEAFIFWGFLPQDEAEKGVLLASLRYQSIPVIFFESPRRIRQTLILAAEILGPRRAFVAREMTKLHEEYLLGPIGDLAKRVSREPCRGEYVVVIEGARGGLSPQASDLDDLIKTLLADGLSPAEIARLLSRDLGLDRKGLYKKVISLRKGE